MRKVGDRFDPALQHKIENSVSKYMREHFTFVCFPVSTMDERIRLEEGIIALLNRSRDFTASPEWKGKYSTESEIVQSGMWLKKGLDAMPLSESEYLKIEEYCNN